MDSATSHLKKTVISSFKQHYNTEVAIIPGGMTPVLQPADVHWNKPFKTTMREKWIQWLSDGEVEYTRSGKRKSASYEMVVHWVSECWKALSNDLIHQSFLSCGITGEASVRFHQRLQLILQDEAVNDKDEEASGLTDTEENEERDEEAEDMEEVDN
ncbi:uncharacterized protein LOC134192574 [Corticium candelabrum]|uniref:uncharacterized protein LOC134192574 n=1 Tax=Corticium candelabrum TaxID=121492 RepID=UPI002E26CBDE|nr:uncharacterized protein LOC134192574 [Corticium candelabrum]